MKLSYLDMMKENPLTTVTKRAYEEAAKQTEDALMSQLNELVKRGLLVIEETEPLLIRSFLSEDQAGYEVRMVKGIRLVLKDQEYIEKLEKTVQDQANQLLEIQEHYKEINERLEKITVAMKKQQE